MINRPSMEERDAALLSPLQLAYMGDTVWEMIVRFRLIQQRLNVHHMHQECVRNVNASAQARFMKIILPFLTETEISIAHRGRNTHAKHPSPKHQSPVDYAEATGFEALLGFLYLTGNDDRLDEIQDIIHREVIKNA